MKIFSAKQKANQILPAAMGKIKTFLFKEQPHIPLDEGLQ